MDTTFQALSGSSRLPRTGCGRSEYIRRNTEGYTVWRSQALLHPEVAVVGDATVLRTEVFDEVVPKDDVVETFHMPMTRVWVRTADGHDARMHILGHTRSGDLFGGGGGAAIREARRPLPISHSP